MLILNVSFPPGKQLSGIGVTDSDTFMSDAHTSMILHLMTKAKLRLFLLHQQEQAQAQGWSKAQKLEGLNTTQGLIGLYVEGNSGARVELNCETDFVAKNSKFHSLLNELVNAKFHHLKAGPEPSGDISIQVKKVQTFFV